MGKSQLAEAFLEELVGEEPDTVVLDQPLLRARGRSVKAFDGIAVELSRYLTALPPAQGRA